MRWSTWIMGFVVIGFAGGCGSSGGGVDAGPDGSTDTDSDTDADTDTDTDSDSDTDAGPDGGEPFDCEEFECPSGGVLYVDADATGDSTGLSWANAVSDLQLGLAMGECCAPVQLWVAEGMYVPGATRDDTFQLVGGVALYGGFAGDEMDLSDRDVIANETILSGDLGIVGDNSDNAYNVVSGANDSTIDGFRITAGNAGDDGSGGGMRNTSSSPTVTNCIFSGNSAGWGGGMSNSPSFQTMPGSSPTLTNCTFSGNAAGVGGGMYNFDSSPTLTNCIFSGNSAGEGGAGGGMSNSGSSPTLTNCIFSGNSAGIAGGGMSNYSSSPTVTNCIFIGNTAGTRGGGMDNYSSSPILANCVLWGDTVSTGSEIYDGSSTSTVTYSNIQGGFTGEGNIDVDPLFVDAASGDLHLQPTSPCIDTGSNDAVPDDVTTDPDGDPRIVDGDGDSTATVDKGAYEYQP